jgi:hypothetical protein
VSLSDYEEGIRPGPRTLRSRCSDVRFAMNVAGYAVTQDLTVLSRSSIELQLAG